MEDIYKLLNFDPGFLIRFPSSAKKVVDKRTEDVISDGIDRLRAIEEDLYIDSMRKVPQQSIDVIIYRVAREARTDGNKIKNWSNKELRILSYYLHYLHNDERAYEYGLKVLDSRWKDFIFNGLVIYLLNNWLSEEKNLLDKVRELLSARARNYSRLNSRYLKIQENIGFLEDEFGATRMAKLLEVKDLPIEESPRFIGFSSAVFSMPYFSEVILKYIEKNNITDLSVLDWILKKHNYDRTRKLAMAYLVIDADENGSELWQADVSRFAQNTLGDITLASTWSPFSGATEEDVAKLRRAKDLIVQWSNRNVIKVFFEKCVKDPARKQYWLKRSSSIVDFRIAGIESVRYLLEKDERTSPIISRYFISSVYKQDTALILCIKDKVFVEFSTVGSLYVYNNDNVCLSPIKRGVKYIQKTSDFKSAYNKLIDIDGYHYTFYHEGRMAHSGDWETRLDKWFRSAMDKREAPNMGFAPNNDDEVFIVKEKKPEFKYVDNIKYMLASKDIPTKKGCFVVVNKEGYYIYLSDGMRYVFVKPLSEGESPNGALLIRFHENGWFKVVHVYMKKEAVVLYVKIEKRQLVYKFDENQEEPIKLRM